MFSKISGRLKLPQVVGANAFYWCLPVSLVMRFSVSLRRFECEVIRHESRFVHQ